MSKYEKKVIESGIMRERERTVSGILSPPQKKNLRVTKYRLHYEIYCCQSCTGDDDCSICSSPFPINRGPSSIELNRIRLSRKLASPDFSFISLFPRGTIDAVSLPKTFTPHYRVVKVLTNSIEFVAFN